MCYMQGHGVLPSFSLHFIFLAVAATNLDEYDSVWLILSSHGDWAKYSGFQADIIYGEDGTSCPIVDLTREFLGIQKPLVTVVQVRIFA